MVEKVVREEYLLRRRVDAPEVRLFLRFYTPGVVAESVCFKNYGFDLPEIHVCNAFQERSVYIQLSDFISFWTKVSSKWVLFAVYRVVSTLADFILLLAHISITMYMKSTNVLYVKSVCSCACSAL